MRLGVLAAATIIIIVTVHYIGVTNRSKALTEKLDQSAMEKTSLSLKNADLEKQNKILEKRLAEKEELHESHNKLTESKVQELKTINSKLEQSKAELISEVETLRNRNEKLKGNLLKVTEEKDLCENKTKFLDTQLRDMKVISYGISWSSIRMLFYTFTLQWLELITAY